MGHGEAFNSPHSPENQKSSMHEATFGIYVGKRGGHRTSSSALLRPPTCFFSPAIMPPLIPAWAVSLASSFTRHQAPPFASSLSRFASTRARSFSASSPCCCRSTQLDSSRADFFLGDCGIFFFNVLFLICKVRPLLPSHKLEKHQALRFSAISLIPCVIPNTIYPQIVQS